MGRLTIGRVGVVGLGKMGGPLARHLAAGGFGATGCDVNAAALAAAREHGVEPAASPAALARRSDLAIVAVGFDSEVERVVFGDDGLLAGARPGAVIAIASTVAPATMRKIAARARSADCAFLDIPMCRGEQAAEDGELLLMGGGDQAVFDACRPAFETFAGAIHYLGGLGAGQVGKMVNNLILWACISANHEGIRLAGALRVSREPLRAALLESSAANWALDVDMADRPMPWAEKDMTIVLKEADDARLSLPLCGALKEVIKGIKIELGQPMPREAGT